MSWTFEQIPNQSGRVAIVTGANSGIGLSTASMLAARGARVILACRSPVRGNAAIESILEKQPEALVELRILDLSSLNSVHTFATHILANEERLDLLINNAGVMMPPKRAETEDGFELQMGVNHLAHQSLTAQLMPLLNKTKGSRVVSVSSMAHRTGRISFDDPSWEQRSYRKLAAYCQSKLANLLFTFELDKRLKSAKRNTIAVAAHPGWTATNLQKGTPSFNFLNPFFGMKPDDGALPTLRAATDPNVQGGEYFGPSGLLELRGSPKGVKRARRASNAENARRLWDMSEEMTGVRFEGLDAS